MLSSDTLIWRTLKVFLMTSWRLNFLTLLTTNGSAVGHARQGFEMAVTAPDVSVGDAVSAWTTSVHVGIRYRIKIKIHVWQQFANCGLLVLSTTSLVTYCFVCNYFPQASHLSLFVSSPIERCRQFLAVPIENNMFLFTFKMRDGDKFAFEQMGLLPKFICLTSKPLALRLQEERVWRRERERERDREGGERK